jgi:hypothetical protein
VVQRTRLSFFSETQIRYSRNPDQCPVDEQFNNVIVLSDEYRCFIAKGDESIPLLRPYLLAAQVGSAECARPRRFRENVEK